MVPPKDNQGAHNFRTIANFCGLNESVGTINSMKDLD